MSHRCNLKNLNDSFRDYFNAGGPGGSVSELASVETVDEERDLEDIRGCKRKRKHSPESSPVDPISDLYAVLEGSALVPFLESR